MKIEVKSLSKLFGAFRALHDIDLTIESGELVTLLGPSGSGKTTLLRIIGGLESPDDGSVWFDGHDATERSARDRRVGFVFQHYALFRNMSVFDNVAFGLHVRPNRPSNKEIAERVDRLLALVQMRGFERRRPAQLSGGQRQRVALARALAVEPKVLLLDEPFGALDAQVRRELRRWLRRLHDEMNVTGVFVTHDQDEALEVADRVVVMNKGAIEQVGVPMEIYDKPATPFVYQFIGNVNRVPCVIADGEARLGTLAIPLNGTEIPDGTPATVFFRPHDLKLVPTNGAKGIAATVRHISVLGANVRIDLTADADLPLEAELPRVQFDELTLKQGDKVVVIPNDPKIFPGAAPAPASPAS
jgi:sulfate/thiosulfate transport system ATP-binding protein